MTECAKSGVPNISVSCRVPEMNSAKFTNKMKDLTALCK